MTKSTTLLALAFLASLFTNTSLVQAAPIQFPQVTKRGPVLEKVNPTVIATQPVADMAGQGVQAHGAQASGAIRDAGSSLPSSPLIQKSITRISDTVEQDALGTGQTFVDVPMNASGMTAAAPV
ncbi:hypothetical protein BGZ96_006149 [Linnemannia gamsii]|uniref:Uncharacterized protein n=1 Tax=Linnemannia gamsii TaxID=64522 RepID=A0ABQ7K5B1_9FUNG|nr:hypothetical protein BGZ96_006149 [Linnemannia gamsii]